MTVAPAATYRTPIDVDEAALIRYAKTAELRNFNGFGIEFPRGHTGDPDIGGIAQKVLRVCRSSDGRVMFGTAATGKCNDCPAEMVAEGLRASNEREVDVVESATAGTRKFRAPEIGS